MAEKFRVRRLRRLRSLTAILGVCLVLFCFFFAFRSPPHHVDPAARRQPPSPAGSLSPALADLSSNLSLTEEQCTAAFPGLTKEVDNAVALGPFELKPTGPRGHLQGRIKDGKLYIIHAQRRSDLSKEMVNSRTASLHQVNRAIVTSPTPLPDTYFSLNFQDQPFGIAWTYSRPADPHFRSPESAARTREFLMPHFSFWAWNLPFVGSMQRAAAAIADIEAALPFRRKNPRAVWRGTAWFSSVQNPRLRQNLLRVARGRDWADVQALDWTGGGSPGAANALPIEDFCRYKYVVHTEGVAYSGRFQFLQLCASVVLTPPIQWLQHTTHFVRPLFSSSLDLPGHAGARWVPSDRVHASWPVQYPAHEANIVFVAPDWSDLEATVAWLEAHPDVAEGIAQRQRELFAGGGYFSPAAETCYWRALIRGWARVARTEGMSWEDTKGIPFEEFILTNGE